MPARNLRDLKLTVPPGTPIGAANATGVLLPIGVPIGAAIFSA